MNNHAVPIGIPFRTELAGIGFFATVRSQVTIQVPFGDKLFVTSTADKQVFASMKPLVTNQAIVKSVALGAKFANERLLPCVSPHVDQQARIITEALLADTADLLLLCMHLLRNTRVPFQKGVLLIELPGIVLSSI